MQYFVEFDAIGVAEAPRIAFVDEQRVQRALLEHTVERCVLERQLVDVHDEPAHGGHPLAALQPHLLDAHGRVVDVDDALVAVGVHVLAHAAIAAAEHENAVMARHALVQHLLEHGELAEPFEVLLVHVALVPVLDSLVLDIILHRAL